MLSRNTLRSFRATLASPLSFFHFWVVLVFDASNFLLPGYRTRKPLAIDAPTSSRIQTQARHTRRLFRANVVPLPRPTSIAPTERTIYSIQTTLRDQVCNNLRSFHLSPLRPLDLAAEYLYAG